MSEMGYGFWAAWAIGLVICMIVAAAIVALGYAIVRRKR